MINELPPIPDRPILFLDYDGTLAPIVDDPAAAFPHPDVPDILERLTARFPVWLVSGRDIATLSRFLNLPLRAIGIHGMEEGMLGGKILTADIGDARTDLQRMKASAPDHPGIEIEEKSGSFAVHYRHAENQELAKKALREWAEKAPQSLIALFGKYVVELRPAGISKGHAVTRIIRDYPDHTPVYIGDDQTDEDAFRMLPQSAVTIKVGSGKTRARHHLNDVEAVVEWLDRLLDQKT